MSDLGFWRLAADDPDFEATDDCTVVLRYLPDEPIWVVRGDERNMKVTDPIDVYIADKLFQLTHTEAPEGVSEDDYREALAGPLTQTVGGAVISGEQVARDVLKRIG